MEKEILERVTYDYYLKAPSYLRYIMDMLPEKLISDEKKYIISRIYNNFTNIMHQHSFCVFCNLIF